MRALTGNEIAVLKIIVAYGDDDYNFWPWINGPLEQAFQTLRDDFLIAIFEHGHVRIIDDEVLAFAAILPPL